jgi:hypothetical protein
MPLAPFPRVWTRLPLYSIYRINNIFITLNGYSSYFITLNILPEPRKNQDIIVGAILKVGDINYKYLLLLE